jgi:hypothetical protein
MNKRSKIALFVLLALVLAFGFVLTGCEGPAGPSGSAGAKGTSDLNEDEVAFVRANGFVVTVARVFDAPDTEIGIVGTTVTWTPGAAVTLTEAKTITIPANVTFKIDNAANAFTVDGVTLTVNGGAGLSFAVVGSAALTTTADAESKVIINVPALALGAPVVNGGSGSIVDASRVSTFDLTASVIDTDLAALGVTADAVQNKEVIARGASSIAAATTLKKLTIAASGTFTLPAAPAALTAPVILNGAITANASGSAINGDVEVAGTATLGTGALTLGTGNKLTVTSGTFTVSNVAITAPGGIILAGGTFAPGTSAHAANVSVTKAATISAALVLATEKTLTVGAPFTTGAFAITATGGVTIADGGTLTIATATSVNVTVDAGGTLTIGNATLTGTVDVSGELIMNHASAVVSTAVTVQAGGVYTVNAAITHTAATWPVLAAPTSTISIGAVTLTAPVGLAMDLTTNGIIKLAASGSSVLTLTGSTDNTAANAASLLLKGTLGTAADLSAANYFLTGNVNTNQVIGAKPGNYTAANLGTEDPAVDAAKDLMLATGGTLGGGATNGGDLGTHGCALVTKASNNIVITSPGTVVSISKDTVIRSHNK